ncbi:MULTISPECIES: STAS domain-containing protein [unclassified Streptomyces]|uniref:STAS domain-containing protein n=1 Tax=unclassified Streptomyces TaxID=2593676 RepID=UPI000F450056|nr:STAS domain-containing protein [Streptomyces sp. I6]RNL72046.1 anti-sigma factor antagonist [Streptomyces sp. I6]
MGVAESVAVHSDSRDPGPCGGPGRWDEPPAISYCRTIDRTLVIALRGVVDRENLYPLRLMLTVAVKSGYSRLVIDCDEITECDNELLELFLSWKRHDRNIVLVHPSGPVRDLIAAEISRRLFLCALSVKHALDLMGQ